MLGYLDDSRRNRIGPLNRQTHPGAAAYPDAASYPVTAASLATKAGRPLNALAVHEWNELPYVMMRLTPAKRRWDGKPLYWQDRTLQLGDIDLDLTKTWLTERAPAYVVTFKVNEIRRAVTPQPSPRAEQTCREFTLCPSFEDDHLRWSSPGITDALKLTTDQLAEKLLSKLVTFYARGLSQA